MAPAGLSVAAAPAERTFEYAPSRRFAFLFLAAINLPLAYLVLRAEPLGGDLQWVVWLLCANLLLGPLGIQLVRLGREMSVRVTEAGICGTNYFGRRVECGWSEVDAVARVFLPFRGAEIVVLPRGGEAKIVFAETIDGLDDLLAIIRERTPAGTPLHL